MERAPSSSPEDRKPKADEMVSNNLTVTENSKEEAISDELKAKREYNRKCAQKSRMKRKQTFVDLQDRVNEATSELNRARSNNERVRSNVQLLLSVNCKKRRTHDDNNLLALIDEALPSLSTISAPPQEQEMEHQAQPRVPESLSHYFETLSSVPQASHALAQTNNLDVAEGTSTSQGVNHPMHRLHGYAHAVAPPTQQTQQQQQPPSISSGIGSTEEQYFRLLSTLQQQQQSSTLSTLLDQSGRSLLADNQARQAPQSQSDQSNDSLLGALWREQQAAMHTQLPSANQEESANARAKAALMQHLFQRRHDQPPPK